MYKLTAACAFPQSQTYLTISEHYWRMTRKVKEPSHSLQRLLNWTQQIIPYGNEATRHSISSSHKNISSWKNEKKDCRCWLPMCESAGTIVESCCRLWIRTFGRRWTTLQLSSRTSQKTTKSGELLQGSSPGLDATVLQSFCCQLYS